MGKKVMSSYAGGFREEDVIHRRTGHDDGEKIVITNEEGFIDDSLLNDHLQSIGSNDGMPTWKDKKWPHEEYIHPTNHDPDIILESSLKQFISETERIKLEGIENNANRYIHPNNHDPDIISETSLKQFISADEKELIQTLSSDLSDVQTFINTTLGEILSNKSEITHVHNSVSTTENGFMNKEDKIKLDGIQSGANYFTYSHPANHPASMIVEDTLKRFVSDTEKNTWNNKASTAVATQSSAGLMSGLDKTKLDSLSVENQFKVKTKTTDTPGYLQDKVDGSHTIINEDDQITLHDDLKNHFTNNDIHITSIERTNWNNKSSLVLGENVDTAYRGDRGKIAYDHSQLTHAPSNAQKNSDITKAEIEAKLIGELSSHNHPTVSTSVNGIMLASDKVKLDGIAVNANNYTHPLNHNATMIIEDEGHRFSTDEEKSYWNSKTNVLFGTSATPPDPSTYPNGTLYIQYS